jgi:hypothetical protein
MTDRERAIVTAHTGINMFKGEKLGILYDYIEEKLGRSFIDLEMATEEFWIELKEKTKSDFISLCEDKPNDNTEKA